MGCFFACFRMKDRDRQKTHIVSKSIASKNRDPLVTKNQLASVFLCEEKGSPSKKVKLRSLQQNFDRENADEELANEVKFLKSCGALLETPAEIRKASEKTMVQSPSNDGVTSNCHSRLPDACCKTLHWDEQSDQLSNTATKVDQNLVQPDDKPGSCCSEENQAQRKILRFDEGVEHISSNLNLSPQIENQIPQLGSNNSPHQTPLNFSEDMYGAGTSYTPKPIGDDISIHTQYFNAVLDSGQNSSQRKELREEALPGQSNDGQKPQQISQSSAETSPYGKRNQVRLTNFKEEADFNEETPKLVIPSLSEWLKPPPSNEERWRTKSSDKSPAADRPIIGLVATHWNENEPPRVSPKWFDGNGIPNSTNKYKEDQKVSWHATPFEERLEKALSDEKLFTGRQLSRSPVNFDDEREESDTAASYA